MKQNSSYRSIHDKVESDALLNLFSEEQPELVIRLTTQAGVSTQLSLIFRVVFFQPCAFSSEHMLLASTSSAYGASQDMPYKSFEESSDVFTCYKSMESMAHSYAHLFQLPITVFRFFTVYGPWGRPDMALFKFTEAILNSKPIDVYNYGNMRRDFTYIDDLVNCIRLLVDIVPESTENEFYALDSKSSCTLQSSKYWKF